ncbi:hypothetical protein HK097_000725 [Rhizophlyctis rosea]|uniref:Glucanase n=1 Tax=Rhizophlyctis rosea TaxID=64517 RepID=A0AAD5X189_9FUNG|nr:hypothetical protein HK097_000725 [Rhizophlyctis rosea]
MKTTTIVAALTALLATADAQYVKPPKTTTTKTTTTTVAPAPTSFPKPYQGNPWVNAEQFINPKFPADVRKAANKLQAAGFPNLAEKAMESAKYSTFIWLDNIASIEEKLIPSLAKAEKDRKKIFGGKKLLVPIIIYNLPERDCSAMASAGELFLNQDGHRKYREEYIDVIKRHIAKYPNLRFALIIEPDSLPNIATNMAVPKCAGAQDAYISGIAYAIRAFQANNIAIYLDIGHGNWLNWGEESRLNGIAPYVNATRLAAPATYRGFASGVSNYRPLWDPTGAGRDETTFATEMGKVAEEAGLPSKWIIDTSRNGVYPPHEGYLEHGGWCNVRGAGMGPRPGLFSNSSLPNIDALVWAKTPGESDGTADRSAERFDENCVGPQAMLNAPEAGAWFQEQFVMLVRNANPPLTDSPEYSWDY